jgi:hypothetical protein
MLAGQTLNPHEVDVWIIASIAQIIAQIKIQVLLHKF